MSLTRLILLVACFALAGVSYEGSAFACLNVKCIAGEAAEGAVEKMEPALARTLADVDKRLTAHEQQIGSLAGSLIGQASGEVGTRLSQVDGILEQRLLQVQLGVNTVLDHGLDRIDGIARARLAQLDTVMAARIRQISDSAAAALSQADEILKNRIGDVGRVVTGAIDQVDGALGARIEQLDEVAGRRLGNVDVIATKQRLGLERTITRAAWLVGLVIFVVVVLRALWTEYCAADNKDAIRNAKSGTARVGLYFKQLGAPLLRHTAVAAMVAGLLAMVPERLPMAAVKEQRDLVLRHATELENSLVSLDWTRVRFHASQLEFLEPADSAHYQVIAAKAELLRDLLGRPTILATAAGVNALLDKVRTVQRLQTGRPDPDVETVRAMIVWQRGTTKIEEHQAATLAARALWSSPRGFTLAPMARIIVEAYLHAPAPRGVVPWSSREMTMAQDKAGLESIEGLAAALAAALPVPPGSPFEGTETLVHFIQELDQESSRAFVGMIEEQAKVFQSSGEPGRREFIDAKKARNEKAGEVVAAWKKFDDRLRQEPSLSSNPLVLRIFRLNDVVLSHALWFTTQPDTVDWPKKLANWPEKLPKMNPGDKALRLAIAPARVVWARRYAALLQGPARELVELQEAQRFERFEKDTLDFETFYGGFTTMSDETPAPARRPPRPLPDREMRRYKAAQAAAALDLYEGAAAVRTPLAVTIGGSISDLQKKVDELLAQARADSEKGLRGAEANAKQKLHDELVDAINTLRALLVGRGPRLI